MDLKFPCFEIIPAQLKKHICQVSVLRLIPYLKIRLTWNTNFLPTVKLEMASTKLLARVCKIEI